MTEKISVRRPFDQSEICQLPLETKTDVDARLSRAYALAQDIDAQLPPYRRIEILNKAATLVEQRAEELALQAATEGGKPLVDSRVELARAVQGIREATRALGQLGGHEVPMSLTESSVNRLAFTTREPIGVVVAISAFNHPFNLIVHQVIPAVAVGCPVIVKPAATTPLSCISLVEILHEAGLPKDWCQVSVCDNPAAEILATDARTSFLTFIGSGPIGWMLRSKLAPGTRCALEHGGAAPVIVAEDADIEAALPLLTKGAFYHAGQVCVSVQRVFIHASIIGDVAEKLVTLANQLIVGDPRESATEVGPLILEREVERIHGWVQQACQEGGTLLCGGEKIGTTCYRPTIIRDPADSAAVSQKEIFGPVMCLYAYEDTHTAIKRANALPFSFQAAVFSRSIDTAIDCAKRLNAAAVMINDHTAFRVDWMPFGGHHQSGLGVGGILPAMEEMTEEKLIVLKSAKL